MLLRRLPLVFAVLALLACQAVTNLFAPPAPAVSPSPSPWQLPTAPTTETVIDSPESNLPGSDQTPANPAIPGGAAANEPATQESESTFTQTGLYQVRLHPDGPLYVGDQVSFEILAPQETDTQGLTLTLTLSEPVTASLGEAIFAGYGIANRDQATLYWAWDTTTYDPGLYSFSYTIQPLGLAFTQTVALQPASQVPPPQPQAHWASTETECCTLHYITGTAAERDLAELKNLVDGQAEQVSQKMNAAFDDRISIVLLPRVLGHGGFSSQEIAVSYLDRNYAGSSTQIVLHHEMVHALDSTLGGELRPTLLVEGLAVYLSGGHFKPEPLMERASALLDLGWYLPLEELADSFYPSQHETGYLEAGALVEYMVETWGWQAFSEFYRSIRPAPDGGSQSRAIDSALQAHFGLTFAELETQFIQALRTMTVLEEHRQDVHLTVEFYDLVRRYQQVLDPSAYFMTAWLPDGLQMRQRGIVADYLRHPIALENLALEALLVNADRQLRRRNFAEAERYLAAIQQALEAGIQVASRNNPLVADADAIAKLMLARGYQVQQMTIQENNARVWASPGAGATAGQAIAEFELVRSQDGWSIVAQLNY